MPEQYAARAHPEPVVLEIGDDLGALVVYTDPALRGQEIEISPTGADDSRSHKDVLNRPVGGRETFAAIFDQLGGGSYTLWQAGAAITRDVVIRGGSITELDWRGLPTPEHDRHAAQHRHRH